MELFTEIVRTSNIRQVSGILRENLPSIFKSKCFNDSNLPFSKEVKNTEVGHLFEHILLEHLTHFKLSMGFDETEFYGETSWNWVKDPVGVFYIDISIGYEERYILTYALEKSIKLMNKILSTIPYYENRFNNHLNYQIANQYKNYFTKQALGLPA